MFVMMHHPPAHGPAETMKTAATMPTMPAIAKVDSTSASERLLSKQAPSGQALEGAKTMEE